MEAEEIRAEIKRRKKRAIDLKLREMLWDLHRYHLSRYPELLKKDPAMILPELKGTLEMGGNQALFGLEKPATSSLIRRNPGPILGEREGDLTKSPPHI